MKENNIKKVLLLGSGALKIGEAGELHSFIPKLPAGRRIRSFFLMTL